MEINKTKLNKIFCWLSLAICGLIMLASAVITKSPFMNDSSGFINMSVIRDPLYQLFLLLFRTVFGDTLYIPVVQVLQSLFVAFAIWSLVMYIKKVFKLNAFIATIMMGGLLVSFAGYAFVSLSGAALTAQILSEGLTIPLFFKVTTMGILAEGLTKTVPWGLLISCNETLFESL